MNLIIDIGNTSTKMAVFEQDTLIEVFSDPGQSLEALSQIVSSYTIEQGIVATVVNLKPDISEQLKVLSFPFLWLGKDTPLPIINLYESPDTLGYDRIAAVVGACARFPEKDILVVDAGTAITYEFVDAKGRYHGGNISPGVYMRFKALNQYTSRLPLVNPEGRVPDMGKDTETAIRAGVMKGVEYEIQGYIMYLRHKYPELLVFLTGGDEFSFDSKLKNIIFADRFLVLKGLNRILNYNNGRI
ncbi:type III pantothenate kinase [Bacteroides sp. 51]|uniref:type III pantothenate kinase n=1 Tax=Bacteroides sp. 51 TaxID=2302938 RepID=UPI00351BC6E1